MRFVTGLVFTLVFDRTLFCMPRMKRRPATVKHKKKHNFFTDGRYISNQLKTNGEVEK